MVTGHLLVGDWFGFNRGVVDYFTNQSTMGMFYFVFSMCYFFTMFNTFWLNDQGVGFYQCYKNFPAKVTFF